MNCPRLFCKHSLDNKKHTPFKNMLTQAEGLKSVLHRNFTGKVQSLKGFCGYEGLYYFRTWF